VDISKLKIYYMEDAGFSMSVLPVDKSIKKCIRRSAEALKKEHNSYVEKVTTLLSSREKVCSDSGGFRPS
jgi:hypothetical protein